MEQDFRPARALLYSQIPAAVVDIGANIAFVPEGTSFLLIRPEGQAIRWRDDGPSPTAAVGYPLAAGAELVYTAEALAAFRFISQVAGAVLNITFYGK